MQPQRRFMKPGPSASGRRYEVSQQDGKVIAELGQHGTLLERLQPMLPTKATEPFDSPDWLFELKWGGVRALAFIDKGQVVLRGQNRRDLTHAYPELHGLPEQLKGDCAVLDGEIVALSSKGYPDLELLRSRLNLLLKTQTAQFPRSSLFYQVSDLLLLDGRVLLDCPLWQRKNVLHAHFSPSKVARVCDFIEGEGVAFFDAVSEHHLEAIIAKNKFSPYRPGQRSRLWLEVPAVDVGYYVIGGYTFGGGRKQDAFQSLLLGEYRGENLVYVGRATAGLSTPEAWWTVRLLEDMHTSRCPFVQTPAVKRFSYWCEPKLVCQVRLGERSANGELRFAVFVSLRPDIPPQDCAVSQPPSGQR